jgi:hypothetical protein
MGYMNGLNVGVSCIVYIRVLDFDMRKNYKLKFIVFSLIINKAQI